jgi:hypothetical protein
MSNRPARISQAEIERAIRAAKKAKAAVTRELVYRFAWGCIENGQPAAAAAAVICFEWLQRPENVLAGYIRWTDYRSADWPNAIKIEHHKTGAVVWHPLEEMTDTGPVDSTKRLSKSWRIYPALAFL